MGLFYFFQSGSGKALTDASFADGIVEDSQENSNDDPEDYVTNFNQIDRARLY